ncbi:hypothetical protein C8Q78DRAFT_369688 [Trametes maxima]|nr:hypothetical protein C8Q78DRAFT_369688 [Trametes maxima]
MTGDVNSTSYTDTTAVADALELHTIDALVDENVSNVLALSNLIFGVDGRTDVKHGSLSSWRNRLSHPSSFILYLAPASNPNEPVAFLFVVPRQHDPPLWSGATDGIHIWLAGVLPEWRAAGCLARMVRELDDVDTLTVCTFPSRFPAMWNWLTRRGWLQEHEFSDGKVLFSRP